MSNDAVEKAVVLKELVLKAKDKGPKTFAEGWNEKAKEGWERQGELPGFDEKKAQGGMFPTPEDAPASKSSSSEDAGAGGGMFAYAGKGLQKKEVEVHRGGKTFTSVRYVKPGEAKPAAKEAAKPEANRPLTSKNVKDGLEIVNWQHPEWGKFVVTHDKNGWIYKNARGSAMLDVNEFFYWDVVGERPLGKAAEPKAESKPEWMTESMSFRAKIIEQNKWARIWDLGNGKFVTESSGPHGWIPQTDAVDKEKAKGVFEGLAVKDEEGDAHYDALAAKLKPAHETVTIRRDKLLRDALAGKLEARVGYHYESGVPYHEPTKSWHPVKLVEGAQGIPLQTKAEFYWMHKFDFKSSTGRAYARVGDPNKIINLHVHGNYSVELRYKE